AARAELLGARGRAGGGGGDLLERQSAFLRHALELERDLAERAGLNRALRELYLAHGRLPEAIRVAEGYAADAPTLSTYLRDRRDESAAFARELRAAAGYAAETLDFFGDLVGQKPQNYPLRAQYADALVRAGRLEEALATLEEAQRILSAGGSADAGFAARLAEIHLVRGDTAAARAALAPVLDGAARGGDLRLVRVLLAVGQTTEAHRRLEEHPAPPTPHGRAEVLYTRGWM